MNIPYVFKKCTKCGRWLVVSTVNFNKNKTGKYGLRGRCKECDKQYRQDNKEKITFICFLIASICFYISAIFCFISETTDSSMGVVHLCLGSAFLCLSSTHLNKEKNDDKNKKGE